MTIDVIPFLTAFSLYLARVSAMVMAVPLFGHGGGSRLLKVGLSSFVAYIMLTAHDFPATAYLPSGALVLALLGEVAIGLTIGWAVRLALSALAVGGHMLGQEMGLNMANMVDPITGVQTPAVATILELFGAVLFFATGLHRELFRILGRSFVNMPVGTVRPSAVPWAHWASNGLSHFFELGFRLVAPAFVVLLMVTLCFGLLMRAVPTINVFDIGFVVRILCGLGLAAFLLPRSMPVIHQLFDALRQSLAQFVGI